VTARTFPPRRLWLGLPTLYELLGVSVDVSLRSFFFSPADQPTVVTLVTWTLVGTGLVVLVWRGDTATRRVVLAILALAVGVYGMIAVGRPPVPGSGLTRQWLAARPRYHYVGGIPIVVLIGLGLAALGRVAWLRTVPRAALVLGVFAVGVVGYLRSDFKIDDHAVCRNHLASMLRGIAAEVERGAPGATVYLENGNAPRELPGPVMVQAKLLFPARAAAFLLEHPVDEVDGRRVRFVERDPAV